MAMRSGATAYQPVRSMEPSRHQVPTIASQPVTCLNSQDQLIYQVRDNVEMEGSRLWMSSLLPEWGISSLIRAFCEDGIG